jgi:hypothetical protein
MASGFALVAALLLAGGARETRRCGPALQRPPALN